MLVAQNIELFTLALSGIAIILILRSKIPDSSAKYRTPGNAKYEIYKSPPLLDDLDPPLTQFLQRISEHTHSFINKTIYDISTPFKLGGSRSSSHLPLRPTSPVFFHLFLSLFAATLMTSVASGRHLYNTCLWYLNAILG